MSVSTACTSCWPQPPVTGGGARRRSSPSSSPPAALLLTAMAAAAASLFFLCRTNLSSDGVSLSLSSPWSPGNISDFSAGRLTPPAEEHGGEGRREKMAEEGGLKEEPTALLSAPPPAYGGGKQTLAPPPARQSGGTHPHPHAVKNFENIYDIKAGVVKSGGDINVDWNLSRLESMLARARFTIKQASREGNFTPSPAQAGYIPQGPIYKNAHAFHRSYLEMEKLFRVYVYEEGEQPLFHDGPCKSIYSMEGRFIHTMELENPFHSRDPERAHVYFLPFSVTKMVKFLYRPKSFDMRPIKRTIVDYVDVIAQKYRYWNRSLGADHFILSCHDWAPEASSAKSNLYLNSIRVLCNANTSEGFDPSKDVSLPEINLKTGLTAGIIGGPSASHRPTLAFFAGGLHGPIRPLLLEHWKGKDRDIQVYEYLPRGMSYYDMMRKAKFCICPSGYEVASPRVVEAIYLECVPVIISDGYVLPFSDVLNWKSFSIQVAAKDIPNLKEILLGVSQRQYIRMQRRVRLVQRHFVVSTPPKRFDVFHMILHSIWLRRLNIRVNPVSEGT